MVVQSEKPQSKEVVEIPLWYKEKRLPTDEEIKEGLGWPTEQQETFLKQTFITEYIPKVKEYLKAEGAPSEVTARQVEQIAAYLYGVYFYNLITGGEIISLNLSYSYYLKASDKAKKLGFHSIDDATNYQATVPLSVDDLSEWPIGVRSSLLTSRDSKASADTTFKKINIYLDKFDDEDPKKVKKHIMRLGIMGGIGPGGLSYQSDAMTEWIRTGIEEAQHLHLAYLRERNKHYKPDSDYQKEQGYIAQGIHIGDGLLEDVISRDEYSETKFDDSRNRLMRYNSLLGNEFAAHIVQAVYTQRYDQRAWKSGYEKYDQEIRNSRKKELKKKRANN
jgi:hypothetical protein